MTYKIKLARKLLLQSNNKGMEAHLSQEYSNNRTDTFEKLENIELNLVIRFLQEEAEKVRKTMIKKIIHLCCLMGMVDNNGVANYHRINSFIEHIGSRNPKQKPNVNMLNHLEARNVLSQCQVIVKKKLKTANS